MKTQTPLGTSLSKAFEAEDRLIDQLVASLTVVNLELPTCRDVAVGKRVRLKYCVKVLGLEKCVVVGEGKWSQYSNTRQVIEHTKPLDDGGFDFSWDLNDSTLSFAIRGSARGNSVNEEGSLTVSAEEFCDECDRGRKNNQTKLKGPTDVGGKFEAWPKNRDRVRITITEPGGKEHKLEIDTDE